MAKRNRTDSEKQYTVYHLSVEQRGLTLAAALKSAVSGCSWGQAQQWIRGRHLQVNGNLCLDVARRVTERDVLKLWREPLAKPIESRDLRVVFADEHLLVVEKPAGVTSVRHSEERKISRHRKQLQPTLEELLPFALARYLRIEWPPPQSQLPDRLPGKPRVGKAAKRIPQSAPNRKALPPELRVTPVHRLDRDTSGLMIFARARDAEQKLIAMFRKHTIEREYWGVALGHVESQTIRSQLVRDRGDGLRGSIEELADGQGQEAVTHVEALEHLPGYTIVRCKLETGRTHQIRIHLSELGHPLCGDKIYTRSSAGKPTVDTSGAPRHALHSDRLAFTHPMTGERLAFLMPLPPDLKRWLDGLRRAATGGEPANG